MMKMATGEGFPPPAGCRNGSRLVFGAIEACGGGTPDLGYFLEVLVFIGIFGVGNKSGRCPSHPRDRAVRPGGRVRPHPRGRPETLLAQLFYSVVFFWSRKNPQKLARQLDSVWYSFSVKLKNREKNKKTGTGL